jgi:TetR/AcrR family transcriptional repressor of multidrug resistance operon
MTDKRDKILKATEKVLVNAGVQGLSMHKVAREANVATGTIYRYFQDKDDLLQQLHEKILTYVALHMMENIVPTDPQKMQFRQIWLNLWSLSQRQDAPTLTREQLESLPSHKNPELQQKKQTLFQPLHAFLDEGKAQGIFKPLPTEILIVIGLEPSVHLAKRRQSNGLILDDALVEASILACWDAIIQR